MPNRPLRRWRPGALHGAFPPHSRGLRVGSADAVSNHDDPVPRNVLYDGQRLWLIDWESAYRNDSLVSSSAEDESVVLEAYSGGRSNQACHRRLALVRAFIRLYYAGVLLSASFAHFGALADSDLSAPTVSELGDIGPVVAWLRDGVRDADLGLLFRHWGLGPAAPAGRGQSPRLAFSTALGRASVQRLRLARVGSFGLEHVVAGEWHRLGAGTQLDLEVHVALAAEGDLGS